MLKTESPVLIDPERRCGSDCRCHDIDLTNSVARRDFLIPKQRYERTDQCHQRERRVVDAESGQPCHVLALAQGFSPIADSQIDAADT